MAFKNILIIDDSSPTRNLVSKILNSAGYLVIGAIDGNDGLMKLNDFANNFQLIITDLNMPNTDGVDFIKMARHNIRHKTTPILVMTTDFRQDKKDKCLQAGATDFIMKPFGPAELIKKVRSFY